MTKSEKLEYCLGCEDNFYNGRNPYDVKECWLLEKSGKPILRKRVHMNEVPPWKGKPEKLFKCFHQKQYIFVEPNINC